MATQYLLLRKGYGISMPKGKYFGIFSTILMSAVIIVDIIGA